MSYEYVSGLGKDVLTRERLTESDPPPTSNTEGTVSPPTRTANIALPTRTIGGNAFIATRDVSRTSSPVTALTGKVGTNGAAKDRAAALTNLKASRAAKASASATTSAKATASSATATAAAGHIKDLEDKLAETTVAVDTAKAAGAPPAEIALLQQQVAELVAMLATAQQDHIAAATAAAEAHREEMSVLQMQINQLVEAMQGAKSAGSDEEVAALQAQVAAMQQQAADSAAAAQAEDQAAAETNDEATELTSQLPWHERYRTHLYIGGGLLAVAAAYYVFTKRKVAMKLPVPVSPASPSGLAANPRRRISYAMKTRAAERKAKKKAKGGRYPRTRGHWRKVGRNRIWIKSYKRTPIKKN